MLGIAFLLSFLESRIAPQTLSSQMDKQSSLGADAATAAHQDGCGNQGGMVFGSSVCLSVGHSKLSK